MPYGPAVCPAIALYQQITCPLTVVLASRGFYAQRRAEVQAVVAARPERVLSDIDSNHNVPMTRPDKLADIILEVVLHAQGRTGGEVA